MIFQLPSDGFSFPDPTLAEPDGLLAIGGDLQPERLLIAYQHGIFPWYTDDTPILWYSPLERFVLETKSINISKSMKQVLRSDRFHWSTDTCFENVIHHCAKVSRKDQDGTWIVDDMIEAFTNLNKLGFAHSLEVWNKEQKLVGGLYGVLVGRVFVGESMFSLENNASKYALIQLASSFDLEWIDCQIYSEHLESMGATMIPQKDYLEILSHQQYKQHGFQKAL